jgi:anti-sigma28 factor (negative regulator of flagellin synthesis)
MSLALDSTRLEMLTNAVMTLPDVRKGKVEALRQLVACGKYNVTDLQIADVLLNDEPNGGSI